MKPLIALLFAGACSAQTAVVGHSFVAMAPWADSGIGDYTIRGFNSEPCSFFQQVLPYLVPTGTLNVVLVEGTNDIEQGVAVQDFGACMQAQVNWIQQQGMTAYVTTISPWNQNPMNCSRTPVDPRPTIAAFNSIFPTLGAVVIDEWTSAILHVPAQAYGWAIPSLMSGPCGIHPGQPQQWPSAGWSWWMGNIVDVLGNSKNGTGADGALYWGEPGSIVEQEYDGSKWVIVDPRDPQKVPIATVQYHDSSFGGRTDFTWNVRTNQLENRGRRWLWPLSVAALIGASALDAASSMGKPEANPILGQTFGTRGLAVKSAAVGTSIAIQVHLRGRGSFERRFTWANFAMAGVLSFVAAHNYRIR